MLFTLYNVITPYALFKIVFNNFYTCFTIWIQYIFWIHPQGIQLKYTVLGNLEFENMKSDLSLWKSFKIYFFEKCVRDLKSSVQSKFVVIYPNLEWFYAILLILFGILFKTVPNSERIKIRIFLKYKSRSGFFNEPQLQHEKLRTFQFLRLMLTQLTLLTNLKNLQNFSRPQNFNLRINSN